MTLTVSYPKERGNTVPYSPLFDDIRRNHGFIDLRGYPELVDRVPEASESAALRKLLMGMAHPETKLMSVGCDLGHHKDNRQQLARRWSAGGYIQVAQLPLGPPDRPGLYAIAASTEARLRSTDAEHFWRVDFGLCETNFKFEGVLETETLWIWFHAAASSLEKAKLSREELIGTLRAALLDGVGSEPHL